jgi:chorismate synthase
MSNSFGKLFRVTGFGESHSPAVGAVIDGCPPGVDLTPADIQSQLTRRRPGQNKLTTPRKEADEVQFLSGVENGKTLGTPIAMVIFNSSQKPGDYSEMSQIPRPSHADYTYLKKYGIKASSGGGRASARETIGRVCAGAVAEKILKEWFGLEIVAWVDSISDIKSSKVDIDRVTRKIVDESLVRCPDLEATKKMVDKIEAARMGKNSVGGVVKCVIRSVPIGLGSPVFDKLEAVLAQAMLSIPATKGFEFGSGFEGTKLSGVEHNDLFYKKDDHLGTITNRSGGIQGGISNGENIYFSVAFKPTATIGTPQETVDYSGNPVTLIGKGRHDPAVMSRAVPIVESMAAVTILDAVLQQKSVREF